jgi:hypothetical protein
MSTSEIVDSAVESSVDYVFHRHNFHAPACGTPFP